MSSCASWATCWSRQSADSWPVAGRMVSMIDKSFSRIVIRLSAQELERGPNRALQRATARREPLGSRTVCLHHTSSNSAPCCFSSLTFT
ncbi:hypothetical protein FAGKG844_100063 [Frankia sp. AgKG'84/4]